MAAVNTYADYLKEPEAIAFEQMADIHRQMAEEVDAVPEAGEYYEDLLKAAARYANFRAIWPAMAKEEKMEQDGSRTSAHNSVITHLNLLARFLRAEGKPAAWRDTLGDEADGYKRKAIGDFACYLAFVSGINAR